MYPAKRRRAIKVASDFVVSNTKRREMSIRNEQSWRWLESGFAARLSSSRQQLRGSQTGYGRRQNAALLTSISTRPRGMTDATLTRNRCPSYPSPVSKTGPAHAASALHCPLKMTHCSQGGHFAQEGVLQGCRAQSQHMGGWHR
ncbi:hypothetical protein V8C42DRAFT_73408 [Trichoderma barbatum]